MADSSTKMRGPVYWDVNGRQNNWNWKIDAEDPNAEIEYQTRFSSSTVGELYKGSGDNATLVATIKKEGMTAAITLAKSFTASTPLEFEMKKIDDDTKTLKWPVTVSSLSNKALRWEYQHLVDSDYPMELIDPETKQTMGEAHYNFLSLDVELPETAVEEIVVTGTAAMFMLAPSMHNDLSIAAEGPDAKDRWKLQDPEYESENEK